MRMKGIYFLQSPWCLFEFQLSASIMGSASRVPDLCVRLSLVQRRPPVLVMILCNDDDTSSLPAGPPIIRPFATIHKMSPTPETRSYRCHFAINFTPYAQCRSKIGVQCTRAPRVSGRHCLRSLHSSRIF